MRLSNGVDKAGTGVPMRGDVEVLLGAALLLSGLTAALLLGGTQIIREAGGGEPATHPAAPYLPGRTAACVDPTPDAGPTVGIRTDACATLGYPEHVESPRETADEDQFHEAGVSGPR
jgi:hypothetical protein